MAGRARRAQVLLVSVGALSVLCIGLGVVLGHVIAFSIAVSNMTEQAPLCLKTPTDDGGGRT